MPSHWNLFTKQDFAALDRRYRVIAPPDNLTRNTLVEIFCSPHHTTFHSMSARAKAEVLAAIERHKQLRANRDSYMRGPNGGHAFYLDEFPGCCGLDIANRPRISSVTVDNIESYFTALRGMLNIGMEVVRHAYQTTSDGPWGGHKITEALKRDFEAMGLEEAFFLKPTDACRMMLKGISLEYERGFVAVDQVQADVERKEGITKSYVPQGDCLPISWRHFAAYADLWPEHSSGVIVSGTHLTTNGDGGRAIQAYTFSAEDCTYTPRDC